MSSTSSSQQPAWVTHMSTFTSVSPLFPASEQATTQATRTPPNHQSSPKPPKFPKYQASSKKQLPKATRFSPGHQGSPFSIDFTARSLLSSHIRERGALASRGWIRRAVPGRILDTPTIGSVQLGVSVRCRQCWGGGWLWS